MPKHLNFMVCKLFSPSIKLEFHVALRWWWFWMRSDGTRSHSCIHLQCIHRTCVCVCVVLTSSMAGRNGNANIAEWRWTAPLLISYEHFKTRCTSELCFAVPPLIVIVIADENKWSHSRIIHTHKHSEWDTNNMSELERAPCAAVISGIWIAFPCECGSIRIPRKTRIIDCAWVLTVVGGWWVQRCCCVSCIMLLFVRQSMCF